MNGPKRALLALWLIAAVSGVYLDFWHSAQFLPPTENRKKEDVLIDVIGEFKTVLARYLWFRMDLFHEVLDDQGVAPERQSEVLPMLRMVTLLDPTMTDSYDQLAWDLYKGQGKTDTALALLEEGLERNPSDYQLNFRKAIISFSEDDYQTSLKSASKALSLTKDEFKLVDCLRLIYWSAKELKIKDIQERALNDLLKLGPGDKRLWNRELEKLRESRR